MCVSVCLTGIYLWMQTLYVCMWACVYQGRTPSHLFKLDQIDLLFQRINQPPNIILVRQFHHILLLPIHLCWCRHDIWNLTCFGRRKSRRLGERNRVPLNHPSPHHFLCADLIVAPKDQIIDYWITDLFAGVNIALIWLYYLKICESVGCWADAYANACARVRVRESDYQEVANQSTQWHRCSDHSIVHY